MKLIITSQFQSFLSSIGLPLGELLRRASIANLLWREELVVTPSEYYRLFNEIDGVISDEQLIAFSQVEAISMFMPPIYGALSAQNGLEAWRRLADYKQLIGPMSMVLNEGDEQVSCQYAWSHREQTLSRFALLYEQLLLVSLLRTGTGKDVVPIAVSGPYNYGPLFTTYLGITPTKSDENQVVFSSADLHQPFLTQNNSMWHYLQPELKKRLRELTDQPDFTSHVQRALYDSIPSGVFSLKAISKLLGVSSRSLQRYLKEENTAFNQQVHQVQQTLARTYLLDQSLTITEIAYLVGYSDASSFARAFKKWTGQTLTSYRQSSRK